MLSLNLWMDNQEKTSLEVPGTATISDIKKTIAEKYELEAPEDLSILHRGRVLENDSTVAELDLSKSNWIICSQPHVVADRKQQYSRAEIVAGIERIITEHIQPAEEVRARVLQNGPVMLLQYINNIGAAIMDQFGVGIREMVLFEQICQRLGLTIEEIMNHQARNEDAPEEAPEQ